MIVCVATNTHTHTVYFAFEFSAAAMLLWNLEFNSHRHTYIDDGWWWLGRVGNDDDEHRIYTDYTHYDAAVLCKDAFNSGRFRIGNDCVIIRGWHMGLVVVNRNGNRICYNHFWKFAIYTYIHTSNVRGVQIFTINDLLAHALQHTCGVLKIVKENRYIYPLFMVRWCARVLMQHMRGGCGPVSSSMSSDTAQNTFPNIPFSVFVVFAIFKQVYGSDTRAAREAYQILCCHQFCAYNNRSQIVL